MANRPLTAKQREREADAVLFRAIIAYGAARAGQGPHDSGACLLAANRCIKAYARAIRRTEREKK